MMMDKNVFIPKFRGSEVPRTTGQLPILVSVDKGVYESEAALV